HHHLLPHSLACVSVFLILGLRSHLSSLFPYTTLFRSILLREGRVRCLGVMAAERQPAPFDQVPTFKEQGYDWTLYGWRGFAFPRSEEHTSELQSRENLVCRLLLEKKKINKRSTNRHPS